MVWENFAFYHRNRKISVLIFQLSIRLSHDQNGRHFKDSRYSFIAAILPAIASEINQDDIQRRRQKGGRN